MADAKAGATVEKTVQAAFEDFCRDRNLHGCLVTRQRSAEHATGFVTVLLTKDSPDRDTSMICAQLEAYLLSWLLKMEQEAETRKLHALGS